MKNPKQKGSRNERPELSNALENLSWRKIIKLLPAPKPEKPETPPLPEVWDYDESIEKIKQWIYKWKTLTEETANELWIARNVLSIVGNPQFQVKSAIGTKVPIGKSWDSYCKEIDSSRQVVNRWLARYFGKEIQKAETPLLPEGKFDVIYADPPWEYGQEQHGKQEVLCIGRA